MSQHQNDTVHIRYINHELRQILHKMDIILNSSIDQIKVYDSSNIDLLKIRDIIVQNNQIRTSN